MRKINIYWVITLLAILSVFVWQLVSLVRLYRFDKEDFTDQVNGKVFMATYKLNATMTEKYPTGNFVGVNDALSRVIYFQDHVKDTIIYDSTIKLIDATNRAMYDIHASTWTLERMDSLFRTQSTGTIGNIPIYFSLTGSNGEELQSLGAESLSSGKGIAGKPIPLGFKMKHELRYNYTYPLHLFMHEESRSIVFLLFLFLATVSSLVILFQSLKQAKIEASYRETVLGTIIHNICSPIDNVTKVTLELHEGLQNELEEPDKELLNGMLKELENMAETATRLLNLNSSMYGVKIKARDTDLPALLEQVIHRYKRKVYPRDKNVKFLPLLDMKNKIVQLDSNYFTEIAQNLIDNSIKYSGNEVKITILIEEHGEHVITRFRDNGNGMPKKYLKHVFKPYSRQDNGNTALKGYGLGLHFVKLAVKAHEGNIKVNSTEGEGTEFIITLPRKSKHYVTEN